MPPNRFYTPARIVSFLVLLLMGSAIVYAASISVLHWTGISV